MINLYGTYSHNIDAKGRLSLPAKFRKKLECGDQSGDLVATVDLSGQCLYVFSEEGYEEWVALIFEKMGGYDPRNVSHMAYRTALMERAVEVSLDAAGRINLPPALREAAGLEKEVDLIGNAGYFEIWDAKRREAARSQVDLSALLVS